MFFNGGIIITFNSFPSDCRNFQVLAHSDFKMRLSSAIIGGITATTLKFVNNARTKERWSFVFKCKKVTNLAFSLENKSGITVREFIFHYAINSYAIIWRDNLPKYGRAITKFFLSTVPTTGLGATILTKNSLMHLSTKSRG